MRQMLKLLVITLVAMGLAACGGSSEPDPDLIALAVQATVDAMPTPEPQIVEVEVTRIVEVVVMPEPTASANAETVSTAVTAKVGYRNIMTSK